FSGSIITAGTFGGGAGGDVTVTTDLLHINGQTPLAGNSDFQTGIQAITTTSDSPAPGGNIQINAGSIDMEHSGAIFTDSSGSGVGGNVNIHAGRLSLSTG